MNTRNIPNQPTRFQFDTVFAADSARGISGMTRARSTYAADEVETMRREAHAAGHAAALAEAAHSQALALTAIAQSASVLIEQFDLQIDTIRMESAGLALAVARKLAGAALSIAPQADLEAFLSECLNKLHREARLVVTVTPDNADYLRSRINELTDQSGFAGRVIVVPEPSMRVTDCRIEWADGGIEKNIDDLFASIEEQLRRWKPTAATEGNDR